MTYDRMGFVARGKFRGVAFASAILAAALLASAPDFDRLPRFLNRIWISSGEIRRSLWLGIVDAFGDDQFHIFVHGSLFLTIIWYWLIGGFFTFMDLCVMPKRMRKYKIQPGTNEPLEHDKLMQVIGQVIYNQIVTGVPTIYVGAVLLLWRNPPPVRQLPDFHWVLLQFVFSAFVEEIGYYYVHRLLHSKHFYKTIHKRHHEWTSPVAVTAMYCHPIEQIVANLSPIFLGPFILNAHLSTYLSWFALAVVFTLSEHSGYHLPFMTSSEYHDYHHFSFTNNFGFLGIMDALHNTNDQFRKSVASSRHFILKSLKSAREHVPDDAAREENFPVEKSG